MNNKEMAKAAIKVLSENKIARRGYSIRTSYSGYSSKMQVTIKDFRINKKQVEGLLSKFKEVDRDQRTGEILLGGNTYVFVEYDWQTLDNLIKEKLEEAREIFNKSKGQVVIEAAKNESKILYFNKEAGRLFIEDPSNHEKQPSRWASDEYAIAEGLAFFEITKTLG